MVMYARALPKLRSSRLSRLRLDDVLVIVVRGSISTKSSCRRCRCRMVTSVCVDEKKKTKKKPHTREGARFLVCLLAKLHEGVEELSELCIIHALDLLCKFGKNVRL